jgi:hypothetical protein
MSSSLFKDLKAQIEHNEHERQARQWAREQEIPYSPPEVELTPREELEQKIDSINEVLAVHASERAAELRSDATIDQSRVGDIIRIELAQLRAQRDQLYNELRQDRGLTAELGLQQEIGIEC